MAPRRAPRAAAALLLARRAALLLVSLLLLAPAARAQPAAGGAAAPVVKPGPLDPDLEAQAKGRLIIVHRPDASDAELTEVGNMLRGGPFKAEQVSRVSIGAGASAFKATILESSELRRGGAAAAGLARALARGAGRAGEDGDAAALRARGAVAYAEPDGIASIVQLTIQIPATWGLDRIDQVCQPLDQSYTYDASAGGAGVNVYVVDTGVYAAHTDFGGRATCAYNAVNRYRRCNDGNGHGTHVSGTIGGATWGVAKKVAIFGVQVLNAQGSGTWSGVVDGINWAVNHCLASGKKCVLNMSLGGGYSSAVDQATAAAVGAGLVVAVAAGNDAADACNSSPASTAAAITVAASDSSDVMASWSNFGSCVDVVAPGVDITSAWNTGPTATNIISGTSMASPHAAGAAALLWSANPSKNNSYIVGLIKAGGGVNVVSPCASCAGTGTTTKLLVYVGSGPKPPNC